MWEWEEVQALLRSVMDFLDLRRLRLFPVSERHSKVLAGDIALRWSEVRNSSVLSSLPEKTRSQLEWLARRVVRAVEAGRPCLVGMGAHLVKLGLGPVLCDLLKKGIVHSIAMNGAAAIHDMELACFGATSEDVDKELSLGRFGMAREPGELFAKAVAGALLHEGLGAALAREIVYQAPEERTRMSLLVTSLKVGRPATVHVAIGTDIVHLYPWLDGGALGSQSMFDFKRFCGRVVEMKGGVYINIGSAVMMPEVFLKAVSAAINLGKKNFSGVTTANFDMLDHYRPRKNVIERIPGEGVDVRGRHEVLLPAFRELVLGLLG